jgi:tetrapyrrole methylase family protein/MazG family protein
MGASGTPRPHLIVVGLGPAGPDLLTGEVRARLEGSAATYLRTARHPAAAALAAPPFVALDHHYEEQASFEEVYRAIVDELLAAAVRHAPEPVVYAVPGSPLVGERTVDLLRAEREERGFTLDVIPALSFLDLAWERVGVDPLAAGVRVVDAAALVTGAGGPTGGGAVLVGQCWSRTVLSDIKLSLAEGADGPDVVLLHHLGLDDEVVARCGWWDLDRTLEPDHLTSLYIPGFPGLSDLQGEMARLEELVLTLRTHCPWDRVQTHGSLMPHLLEEAYEVLDALRALDAADAVGSRGAPTPGVEVHAGGDAVSDHLQEELGDLLFQIAFHARLAEEQGRFTLAGVARSLREKLVHRHPHVFGDGDATTAQQVVTSWEAIKKAGKGRTSVTEGVPLDLPALLLAAKMQRKALSVGLPPDVAGEGGSGAELPGGEATAQSMGEALFAIVALARRGGVDPEQALRDRTLALRDAIVAHEAARGDEADAHQRR